jgi:hypothetical protein
MPRRSSVKVLFAVASLLVSLSSIWAQTGGRSEVATGPVYNGVEVAIDLPVREHVRNFGAPKDGQGLCVFASLTMAARWSGTEELYNLIHQVPYGGGWPAKVDYYLGKIAPDLPYVQYQGTDPAILDQAIALGRPVCVTYGYGEFYSNKTIAHMVLLAHLDNELAAIIDNNDPDHWTWMSRAEFLKRAKHPSGQFWAVVLLDPPPPLVPTN